MLTDELRRVYLMNLFPNTPETDEEFWKAVARDTDWSRPDFQSFKAGWDAAHHALGEKIAQLLNGHI